MPARAIRFQFRGGDLDGLAYAASEEGFSLSPTEDGEGLILVTTAVVDELRYPDFDDLMHEWAGQFSSRYEGWGAEP